MNARNRTPRPPSLGHFLRAAGIAAAMAMAAPLYAQECSGGSAGGADATGNQCNDPVAALAAPAPAPAPGPGAASKPVAAAVPSTPAPPIKAAAHRKKVFDERRARFEDPGHPRVAGAPIVVTATPPAAP